MLKEKLRNAFALLLFLLPCLLFFVLFGVMSWFVHLLTDLSLYWSLLGGAVLIRAIEGLIWPRSLRT